jgi:hypothetical protein
MSGIPLISSPPVKHESPANYQGYEVTKYQPPWSSFSDFAMRVESSDDCSQTPGFQYLVNQVSNHKVIKLFRELILNFLQQLHGFNDTVVNNYASEWHNKNRDSIDSYQESEESVSGSL